MRVVLVIDVAASDEEVNEVRSELLKQDDGRIVHVEDATGAYVYHEGTGTVLALDECEIVSAEVADSILVAQGG